MPSAPVQPPNYTDPNYIHETCGMPSHLPQEQSPYVGYPQSQGPHYVQPHPPHFNHSPQFGPPQQPPNYFPNYGGHSGSAHTFPSYSPSFGHTYPPPPGPPDGSYVVKGEPLIMKTVHLAIAAV